MPPAPHAAGYPEDFVAHWLDRALALPRPRGRPPVFGLAGLQGTGKSTLAAQLRALGAQRGVRVAVLSIDDFYLTRRERLRLGRTVHPLLATRGPPGTHDVALACATVDALRSMPAEPPRASRLGGDALGPPEHHGRLPLPQVRLPRFDKIADRRLPASRWTPVRARPALVVFEGWFLKVPPEDEAALRRPLNALERDADPDGTWRRWCNAQLPGYSPLWRRLDFLLFLQGPGFERVPAWRWQQERTLQAQHPGRRAMSRREVERFVLFFERVSRQALRTLPAIAEATVRVDAHRRPRG
jgi:D-glycerate 3-kinase